MLALEASRSESAPAEARLATPVFDKLRSHLSRLVGIAGFQALLTRALALAKTEVPWLEAVRVQPDATLEGFSDTAQQQSTEEATEGSVVLLAHLIGLLVTFIGETLTLQLLGNMWPEARECQIHSGAEETGHE